MKKKIVFFITGLNSGGAENQIFRIVSNINKELFDVKVISFLGKGVLGEKILDSGIEVYDAGGRNNKIKGILNVYNYLKKINPDILVCFLYHAIILGRILGKLLGIKCIISSIRNINSGGKIRDKVMKLTDNFSHVINTNSNICAKKLQNKVTNREVNVITNCVDIEKFKKFDIKRLKYRNEFGIRNEEFVWLSIGRLEKQKNYEELIKCIYKLKHKYKNIKLFIIGIGSLEKKLKNLCIEYGIRDNVIFLLERTDISEIMNMADGFVLSSLWEGMPNVIMEAQACELVSVATNVGGVSEVILNNESGFVVQNYEELTNKMDFIMKSEKSKLINMGKKGREYIKNNYSIENIICKWENLFLNYGGKCEND